MPSTPPVTATAIEALPVPASLLGESPCWHPAEQVLYWCDIPGRKLERFDPASGSHRSWSFDVEPASCAPLQGGGLLLAMRDGLWRFDTGQGKRSLLADAPYDAARQRFNDGKADPQGRFWVGTLDEAREPRAALYRHAAGRLDCVSDGITVSNGLGWSPDGRTMYWSDTRAHVVRAFDFDGSDGSLSRQRVLAQFEPRGAGQPLDDYGGRPDGAAVDTEGAYWVAMFEGSRLLRLSPEGRILGELRLPVRCATMPCFGGHDLRTLYITTSRENRPADELARQPLAGCVLHLRVPVAGLPANFAVA
jgi:sugar lactone lactonase YvrE